MKIQRNKDSRRWDVFGCYEIRKQPIATSFRTRLEAQTFVKRVNKKYSFLERMEKSL